MAAATVAFNLLGVVDLLMDYYHAIHVGLAAVAGELGAAYAIPIIYVPLLMITHVAALHLLMRSLRGQQGRKMRQVHQSQGA
jgi:hypothetical protein